VGGKTEGREIISGLHRKDIDPKDISTSLVERRNLTLRQDNNRIPRKTIGFSKRLDELDKQMTLYFAHFNFCRGHGSLIHLDCSGRKRKSSPAKECGLTDHNWSLRELLTYPYHRKSNWWRRTPQQAV